MSRGPWIELLLFVAVAAWVWDRYTAEPEPEPVSMRPPVATGEVSEREVASGSAPHPQSEDRAPDEAKRFPSLERALAEEPGFIEGVVRLRFLETLEAAESGDGDAAWDLYQLSINCQRFPATEDWASFAETARAQHSIDGTYIHDPAELESRLTALRSMRDSCDEILGDRGHEHWLMEAVAAGHPAAVSARYGQVLLNEDPEMAAALIEPLLQRGFETCEPGGFAALGSTSALAGDTVTAEAAFMVAERLAGEDREHRGNAMARDLFPYELDANGLSTASLRADEWLMGCASR